MKKLALGVAVLAVIQIGFAVVFFFTPRDPERSTGAVAVTVRLDEVVKLEMPALKVQRPDRTIVDVASLRGKPVVLHLWGTWCPPCVRELPRILDRAASEKEPVMLAVAVEDDWEALEAFFDGPIPAGVVVPTSLEFVKELGVTGLPATLLIGADGVVTKRWSGERDWTASDWSSITGPAK